MKLKILLIILLPICLAFLFSNIVLGGDYTSGTAFETFGIDYGRNYKDDKIYNFEYVISSRDLIDGARISYNRSSYYHQIEADYQVTLGETLPKILDVSISYINNENESINNLSLGIGVFWRQPYNKDSIFIEYIIINYYFYMGDPYTSGKIKVTVPYSDTFGIYGCASCLYSTKVNINNTTYSIGLDYFIKTE